jgi:hypothetical protein
MSSPLAVQQTTSTRPEKIEPQGHASLLVRMRIINGDRMWVFEDTDRVRKSDPMFVGVGPGLLGVPLEAHAGLYAQMYTNARLEQLAVTVLAGLTPAASGSAA